MNGPSVKNLDIDLDIANIGKFSNTYVIEQVSKLFHLCQAKLSLEQLKLKQWREGRGSCLEKFPNFYFFAPSKMSVLSLVGCEEHLPWEGYLSLIGPHCLKGTLRTSLETSGFLYWRN